MLYKVPHRFLLLFLPLALGMAACDGQRSTPVASQGPATYVGAPACGECHATEFRAWQGSHHDLAMQVATEQTVLGDFVNAKFQSAGQTTTFFRRDGGYFVNTDGPDGKLADYAIKYAFGITPLQQYLIEFPDGRLQALSISWDSRPAGEGGQRWFHLYEGQGIGGQGITHTDPLHWTKPSQNWNFMCAECHSTDLRRNYDVATDRFKTQWSDINVTCEACHGPASNHLAWARATGTQREADKMRGLVARFKPRAAWNIDPATGNARRAAPRQAQTELETCALCHARRAQLLEGHQPGKTLANTHLPVLLTAGLYHADGQMQDEVYNYGSFLQSKMHAQGVSCSDCHEPHSLKLRAPGSAVCAQCHATDKYAAAGHHRHAPGSAAAECVSCHMPVRTYMVVDPRHDHSFRVPRPDLSVSLGTPNACNDCHADQSAAWAADAVTRWHGTARKGMQNFAPALYAARAMQLDAPQLLAEVAGDGTQPAIARATALSELAPWLSPVRFATLNRGLDDPDPLVRIGALQGLEGIPSEQRWATAGPMLKDPVLAVRMTVVGWLLAVPPGQLQPAQRQALAQGIEEYLKVQMTNADRADARVNMALVWQYRGDVARAESELQTALRLDPSFTPGRVNLADLYRALGREPEVERVLREGLAAFPDDASLHYALGLNLVRTQRVPEAIRSLRRAAALAPEVPRYAYVYAIALDSTGETAEALRILRDSQQRHPADGATLQALVDLLGKRGDEDAARTYSRQLAGLYPDADGSELGSVR
jgi:tetratricopeptide (TPR) repeat protein